MIIKNYLTKILKSFLLRIDVVSVLPGISADAMSPVLYCTWENSSFIPERGVFCVSLKSKKTFYGSTTNQKASSEKLGKSELKSRLKNINTRSLSKIFTLVKGKFADTFFKPITSQKVLAFE